MSRNRQIRPGFTLVELLVVIAIIGILVALLLPAIQAAREAARRMSCSNNIKQLAIGLHNYHDTYKTFPPDAIWHGNPRGTTPSATTVRNYTWIALLLPFIEQAPLHSQINFRLPALTQLNSIIVGGDPAIALMIPSLICPSDPNFTKPPWGIGITSYAGNAGWDHYRRKYGDTWRAGVFTFYDATRLQDIRDGTTNTVMLGEVTLRSFCCRPGPNPPDVQRWQGGSGRLRAATQAVSRTALIATSAHSGFNHVWTLAENKGDTLQADGVDASLWGVWTGPNHLHPPTYYPHYSMNTEWPAPGSVHPGGAQFGLCDASVRFISYTVSTGQAASVGGNSASYGINGNIWFGMHTIEGLNDINSNQVETPITWEN